MILTAISLLTIALPAALAWWLIGSSGFGTGGKVRALLVGGTSFMALVIVPAQMCEFARRAGAINRVGPLALLAAQAELSVALLLLVARAAPEIGLPLQKGRPLSWPMMLTFGFVALSIAALGADAATSYPGGREALASTLPRAVRWLQDGGLTSPPPSVAGRGLPGNEELGLMILFPAVGQRLSTAFSLLGALMAAASTHEISRKVVPNSNAESLAPLLFLSLPVVQYHAFQAEADLFGAGFLLAGLALFLGRDEPPKNVSPQRGYAWALGLTGLSLGLASGTQRLLALRAAVLMALIFIVILRETQGTKTITTRLALFLVATILPCAIWYIGEGFPIRSLGTTAQLDFEPWPRLAPLRFLWRLPPWAIPEVALVCVLAASWIGRLGTVATRLARIITFGLVAVLCMPIAVDAARSTQRRINAQEWMRFRVYHYFRAIDDFSPGSRVLEMNEKGPDAFMLAGRYLTNKVIPRSTIPGPITREALLREGIDYIYESPASPSVALQQKGAFILAEGYVDRRPDQLWRLWKVDRGY